MADVITRRQFMRNAGILTAALLSGSTHMARGQDDSSDRPNFVFILIDDLGWMDVGYHGSRLYETPNVDRLARSGMRFSDAYAACPVCSPTRSSIMSGKYPARLHQTDWIKGFPRRPHHKLLSVDDKNFLPREEVTVAESLKEAGYVTCHIGKWHMGGEGHMPTDQGFDYNICGGPKGSPPGYFYPWKRQGPGWDELRALGKKGDYLTDLLSHQATDFIREHQDQPFFLYLAHFNVHTPRQAKQQYKELYQKKLDAMPAQEGPAEEKERYDARTKLHQDDPTFAGMVQSMDESVGRVLDCLEETGLDENTVVVFMSDNGGLSTLPARRTGSTSNAPLRAGKGWCYEGGIREPCIIKWPGHTTPMSLCSEPVISTDFYPTMLAMAGLPLRPRQHMDGRNLAPLLTGQKEQLDREAIYWHYPHYHGSGSRPHGAMRKGRYKLIEFYEDMSVEVYDLEKDERERNDLSEKMPEKTVELREEFHAWLDKVDAQMPKPNPDYNKS